MKRRELKATFYNAANSFLLWLDSNMFKKKAPLVQKTQQSTRRLESLQILIFDSMGGWR